ncbi:MAG: fatty acid hydroxylase, partial [Nodosilinea sp.]
MLRANSAVLLDGCLGALPYLLLGLILAPVSPWGAWIGLIIGQLHVWWRHTTALGWQTPPSLQWLCDRLGLVTPERH